MPSITGWSGYGYVWILFFIILCDEVIHDIPKFIFKPVNHFYSYTWTRRGLNFMVHYFTFITLIFRPIVKSFLPICFRNFCIRSNRYKEGLYFMTTFFLYPFFSCSDIHQSQYLDGCQAMGKSTFFIEAFCALRFWWYTPSGHSITPSLSAT